MLLGTAVFNTYREKYGLAPLLRCFNGGDDLVLVPLVFGEILRELG
jgi:hypothetical protein